MLVLVGHLEGEIAHIAPRLGHKAASQVIQEIRLAAIGLSGGDYQPALVGGMKHMVGKRTVTHIVTVVVIAAQHIHNLIRTLTYRDDVRRMVRTRRVDNLTYHTGTVHHKYVGYILTTAGQYGEQATRTEIVGKMLHKRSSGQVAVAANHQFPHPVQPGAESLKAFGKVACRAVGYADDVRISRLMQGQHIPFTFGDNQTRNVLFGNPQRIDAVDIVRRARRGGRLLAPALGITGGGNIARAVFHIDGLPVDVIHIGDTVVHHSHSVLFILFTLSALTVLTAETAVHQATDTRIDSGFQGNAHIGKVAAGRKLFRV